MVGRNATRWGALWGLLFGFYIAESAIGFKSVGGSAAARAKLARTLGTNKGMAALFGPAFHIDTVGGFTAWRSLGFLGLLGAVIGLLLATRLLRGEEAAGRYETLLAGHTTRSGAAAQALLGLAAGLLALFGVTALIAVAGGRKSTPHIRAGGMLAVTVAVVAVVAVFMAVGALASQLATTRRRAAALSAMVFGASFLVRAAADSAPSLRFARWATPLGWPSLFHPLTGTRPIALVPPVVTVVLLGAVTIAIAGRRDFGAAVLPSTDTAKSRTGLLGGQAGLAVRVTRGAAYGWTAGLAVTGLFLGLIAQSASESVSGSNAVHDALARLGAHRSGALSYLGLAFLTVTALTSFAGASMVGATRDEEADGMLDNLLVRPVGRTKWLSVRVAAAIALTVICGLTAGVATWIGASTQHTGIGLATMLAAGINAVPPAVLLVGLGTLAHGVIPRQTKIAVYGVLVWGFLIQVLASATKLNRWLLDTSILHHVTPAPATSPDWTSAAVLVALGLLGAVAGAAAFEQRDLVGA